MVTSTSPQPHESDINAVAENNLGALWTGAKTPHEIVQTVAAEASQYLVERPHSLCRRAADAPAGTITVSSAMLRVTVYLKSGAVAAFDAEAILESAEPHPKFRLEFAAPEQGGRRLVYLDRDDVSAVVVEEGSLREQPAATRLAAAIAPVPAVTTEDVLTVSLAESGPAAP